MDSNENIQIKIEDKIETCDSVLDDFISTITNNIDEHNFNWTDKYHPKNLDDCLLKLDDKNKINQWITSVKEFSFDKEKEKLKDKKENCKGKSKSKKVEYPKNCLLLHGPPGIGKTTISKLIFKLYNYDILEFNASDTRTAKTLEEHLGRVGGSHNIVDFMCKKKTQIGVILDEIDGLSQGDKGGLGEINAIIANSLEKKTPFICITNTFNKKMETLKRKSIYIKLSKPTEPTIIKIINKIIKCEKLDIIITSNTIKKIAEKSQGDIRRAITLLEYFFRNNKINLENHETNPENTLDIAIENYSRKFTDLAPYEMADKILNSYKHLDFFINNFNYDNSMTNWYIYENFIRFIDKNRIGSFEKKIEAIENMFKYFAEGDIVEKQIIQTQSSELYGYTNIFKTHSAAYFSNTNLKKTSYNKMGMMNYSTLLNKTSQEFLNSKSWTAMNCSLQNNQDTNITTILYDIIWKQFEIKNYKYLQSIIKKYNINQEQFEKILKGSCYFEKNTNLNQLRKKIKLVYVNGC